MQPVCWGQEPLAQSVRVGPSFIGRVGLLLLLYSTPGPDSEPACIVLPVIIERVPKRRDAREEYLPFPESERTGPPAGGRPHSTNRSRARATSRSLPSGPSLTSGRLRLESTASVSALQPISETICGACVPADCSAQRVRAPAALHNPPRVHGGVWPPGRR
jgi:hypothetical protein